MLLSCAIWTVSTFFLWNFLLTVTTQQDVSQTLKEKSQRVKFGFCKRKGEKNNGSSRVCWLRRAPSWQWARLLAWCCAVPWQEVQFLGTGSNRHQQHLLTRYLSHLPFLQHPWAPHVHPTAGMARPQVAVCHGLAITQQTPAGLAGFCPC